MLKRVCLVGALMTLTAVPALADMSCGSAPIAPAVPGTSDIAGKTPEAAHQIALGALKNVKSYQGSLATFRQCLKTHTSSVEKALNDAKAKGDKDKTADLQSQIDSLQSAWDKTVDTETQVVNDYMKLHNAYCQKGTGLPGCAK